MRHCVECRAVLTKPTQKTHCSLLCAGATGRALVSKQALDKYLSDPNLCGYSACSGVIYPKPGRRLSETKILKFCSQSCAAKHNNNIRKVTRKGYRHKEERTCSECGEVHIGDRTDKCWPCVLAYRLKLAMRTKGNSLKRNIRGNAKQYVKDRPQECVNCKFDLFVEICHIRPIADFPDSAFLTEINHPDNLILLCPNCHWMLDHNMLDLDGLLSLSGPSS